MLPDNATGYGNATSRRTPALFATIASFAIAFERTAPALNLDFDGSSNGTVESPVDLASPAAPAATPAIPQAVPQTGFHPAVIAKNFCKLSRQARKAFRPPAAGITPEIVSDISAFSLTQDEIDQAGNAVPAPESPLGLKILSIMRRAYVGGTIPEPNSASDINIVPWNVNAAHTRAQIDALIAAFQNNPAGVRQALGRRQAVSQNAVLDFTEFSQTDVYLLQEVPLPTAVELAQTLGMQVFWVPEFLEVGDNALGRDPLKAENFTGNAILSRVPLSDFHILRYNNQSDWYYTQKASEPLGDKLTKIAAGVLFAADPGKPHQTRPPFPYGGRVALFAQADVSGHKLWLGNLHLEDKPAPKMTGPELRCSQAIEAAQFISGLPSPRFFAGDLNTFGDNVGIGEGSDMATEGPNVKHPSQAPVDRQSGWAAGTSSKFFGGIEAADLATTLTHHPGSRKRLVIEQSVGVAVNVVPYAPTVRDGLNAIRKVKRNPTPATIAWSAASVSADLFPYTAAAYWGYRVFADERGRHNPSSRVNPDNHLFRTLEHTTRTRPLNPRLGYRAGVGGYESTWASGRDLHLFNTVLDWAYLSDSQHTVVVSHRKVLKDMVNGSKRGSGNDGRLSDHYPLKFTLHFNNTSDGVSDDYGGD